MLSSEGRDESVIAERKMSLQRILDSQKSPIEIGLYATYKNNYIDLDDLSV